MRNVTVVDRPGLARLEARIVKMDKDSEKCIPLEDEIVVLGEYSGRVVQLALQHIAGLRREIGSQPKSLGNGALQPKASLVAPPFHPQFGTTFLRLTQAQRANLRLKF